MVDSAAKINIIYQIKVYAYDNNDDDAMCWWQEHHIHTYNNHDNIDHDREVSLEGDDIP